MDELLKAAREYGYELRANNGDYTAAFCFNPQTKIALQVFNTEEFALSYVTDNMFTLSSGKAGSFRDKKHFRRIENDMVKLVNKLRLDFDPDTQIADIWCIDDINSIRPDLDDEQCMKVLLNAQYEYDANEGISWKVLESHANDMFPKGGYPREDN